VPLFVLLLCAITAFAQSRDPSAEVEARLAAGTPPDLAWAARIAADNKLPQYTPQLIEMLHHSDNRVRANSWAALVALQARLPDDILEGPVRAGNDAALILLVLNSPEFAARLLEENRLNDKAWIVLNSWLFPKVNAGRMLHEWTMPVTVYVADKGVHVWTQVVNKNMDCADSFPVGPDPYPPPRVPHIRQSVAQETQTTSGPHPLNYAFDGLGYCLRPVTDISRDQYTLDFLRALANFDEAPPHPVIRYTNEAQYRTATKTALRNLRAYYNRLHAALIAKGAIPAGDHTIPPLKVTVEDQRTKPLPVLPEIRWLLP
jgi:hypothetical protein